MLPKRKQWIFHPHHVIYYMFLLANVTKRKKKLEKQTSCLYQQYVCACVRARQVKNATKKAYMGVGLNIIAIKCRFYRHKLIECAPAPPSEKGQTYRTFASKWEIFCLSCKIFG